MKKKLKESGNNNELNRINSHTRMCRCVPCHQHHAEHYVYMRENVVCVAKKDNSERHTREERKKQLSNENGKMRIHSFNGHLCVLFDKRQMGNQTGSLFVVCLNLLFYFFLSFSDRSTGSKKENVFLFG